VRAVLEPLDACQFLNTSGRSPARPLVFD